MPRGGFWGQGRSCIPPARLICKRCALRSAAVVLVVLANFVVVPLVPLLPFSEGATFQGFLIVAVEFMGYAVAALLLGLPGRFYRRDRAFGHSIGTVVATSFMILGDSSDSAGASPGDLLNWSLVLCLTISLALLLILGPKQDRQTGPLADARADIIGGHPRPKPGLSQSSFSAEAVPAPSAARLAPWPAPPPTPCRPPRVPARRRQLPPHRPPIPTWC